jgi:protein phosphatase 1L
MFCGEEMVAQWTHKNWWKSVISSSDSALIQKRVLLHLKEFLFCVKVLTLIASNHGSLDGRFVRPDVDLMFKINLLTPDVEKASQRDIESLLGSVEAYRKRLFPTRDGIKLAEYVVNKFRVAKYMLSTNSDHGHLRLIDYDDVKLGDLLGRRPFGVVFKCEFLGEKAAAKVFRSVSTVTGLKAVQNEAALQARLRHPNVVQFIGYAVKGSMHCIVTELMSMDLQRYLHELSYSDRYNMDHGRLHVPLLLAINIMLQIAEAMKYFHETGVMYSDLKASSVLVNVMESVDSYLPCSVQVKLNINANSQLSSDNSGFTTMQVGTNPLSTPDVFEDDQNTGSYMKSEAALRFAMVFFEVLTGEEPFANMPQQILPSIRQGDRPTLPSDCPAHLSATINKCWATRPEDRPEFSEICQILVGCKGTIMSYSSPSLPFRISEPRNRTNDGSYTGSIIAMGNTEKWAQGNGRIANLSGGGFSEFPAFSFGYSSLCGKVGSMQVFHQIPEIGDQAIRLFGVVDGHGLRHAAYYVARHLFDSLLKHPKLLDDTKLAIAEAFEQTDQDYLKKEDDQQSIVGSTACTAVLVGERLLVANVGDSRAVICRGGNAVVLSCDHKPTRTDEWQRIDDMGGIVIWDGTHWLAQGVGGLSRAFGDRLLKQYVVAEPEIQEVTIEEGVDFLVLGSAGLWDVVSNQDAVSMVQEYIADVEEAANRLTEEAHHRGSTKNITCVIVCFNHNHLLQSRP